MLNVVLYRPEIPANTGNIGRTCVVTGARLHLVGPLAFDLSEKALHRAGLGYWGSLDVVTYADWDDFCAKNPQATGARLHLLTKHGARVFTQATYHDGDWLVFGRESDGLPPEILAAHPGSCERIPMLPDAVSLSDADDWARRHDTLAETAARGSGDGDCEPQGATADNHDGMQASPKGEAAGDREDSRRAPIGQAQPGYGNARVTTGDTAADSPEARGLRRDICGNFVPAGGAPGDDPVRISALNLSNSVAIVLYEALRQLGYPGM